MGTKDSRVRGQRETKPDKKNRWNPISEVLDHRTIMGLRNRWDAEQLQILEERAKPHRKNGWTLEQFLGLFPKLCEEDYGYSQDTCKNLYQLFRRSGSIRSQNLTNQQIIEALTLIQKGHNSQLISKMIFYLYSHQQSKEMTKKGFQRFINQNLRLFKDSSNAEAMKNWWPDGKTSINPEKFQDIFDMVNIAKFRELFEPDFSIAERQMVESLKIRKGFSREVGSQTFLVEYQWFLLWKNYMFQKYGIEPKVNDKGGNSWRKEDLDLTKSRVRRKIQDQSILIQRTPRPGSIPNYLLLGDEKHQLRHDMKQFRDFIMVPGWLMQFFLTAFRGHPIIKRLYPQIYCSKVYQVFVDNEGRFRSNEIVQLPLAYKEMKISEIFQKYTQETTKKICMFKCPGNENWTELHTYDLALSVLGVNKKLYFCFMPELVKEKFIDRYNVVTFEDGNKKVDERIANYATMLSAPINGVIRRGFVTRVLFETVVVEYRNQEGRKHEKQLHINTLASHNNNFYLSHEQKDLFAGFANKKGFSYMNAVIQCLIRTPLLHEYLKKMSEKKPQEGSIIHKDPKELGKISLVVEGLAEILQLSTNLSGVVNINPYRQKIEKEENRNAAIVAKNDHFFDAFQFMINLLVILEKQSQQMKQVESSENIIRELFTAVAKRTKKCQKCKKIWVTDPVSLYGLSLELPENRQFPVYFYFFPIYTKHFDWKPQKYGLKVSILQKKEEFIERACGLLGRENVEFYAMLKGQLRYRIRTDNKHHNIREYLQKGMKILCYEIKNKNNIRVQVQTRKKQTSVGRRFLTFGAPLLLEIGLEGTWGQLLEQIQGIFYKKFKSIREIRQEQLPNHSYHELKSSPLKSVTSSSIYKSLVEINVYHTYEEQSQDDQEYVLSPVHSRMRSESSIAIQRQRSLSSSIDKYERSSNSQNFPPHNQSFSIRITEKSNPHCCFRCGRQFGKNGAMKGGFSSAICKQRCFTLDYVLREDEGIVRDIEQILVVIDWNDQRSFTGFEHNVHASAKALQEKEDKKQDLNVMLKTNPDFCERLDDQACQQCHQMGTLTQTTEISEYPNILTIQLKRFFRAEDGTYVKKFHQVEYPPQLFHEGEQYWLFGVVGHRGAVSSGEYYCYVRGQMGNMTEQSIGKIGGWFKCDEQRVQQCCPKDVKGDQNAYMLLYARVDIDPCLLFDSPLF